MKKTTIFLFLIVFGFIEIQAQDSKLKNNIAIGYQVNQYQNDFGFDFSYQTFEPSGRLNNYRFNFFSNYRRLVDPNTFARFNFGGGYRAFTKNLNAHGFRLNIQPGKQYDYFESRDGRPFIFENSVSAGAWFSSNYNKVFAIDLRANAATLFEEGRDLFRYDFEIEPRIVEQYQRIVNPQLVAADASGAEGGEPEVIKLFDDE